MTQSPRQPVTDTSDGSYAAYAPESLFRTGTRVRYDEFTGRVVGVSWVGGVLRGYRIEWDDGYVDDPGAPLYSDAELEPVRDARDTR